MIESQLSEKFGNSEEDINNFYQSLQEEGAIKVYQEINSDTLDALFGFIDF